ncbi:hypothetical protein FS749_008435 [Ceratobasidium sp. UAMH 11750]|nr:hypothetical protein FS749_008435 [Ceratobasidium sp. UAMH 11750]
MPTALRGDDLFSWFPKEVFYSSAGLGKMPNGNLSEGMEVQPRVDNIPPVGDAGTLRM